MKNVFTNRKVMINFVFVKSPRVKNRLGHFVVDKMFSALFVSPKAPRGCSINVFDICESERSQGVFGFKGPKDLSLFRIFC